MSTTLLPSDETEANPLGPGVLMGPPIFLAGFQLFLAALAMVLYHTSWPSLEPPTFWGLLCRAKNRVLPSGVMTGWVSTYLELTLGPRLTMEESKRTPPAGAAATNSFFTITSATSATPMASIWLTPSTILVFIVTITPIVR